MRKGPGRPPYQPTQKDRNSVSTMAIAGLDQDKIASVLGIAPKTLRLHFRSELDNALAQTLQGVAAGLVSRALNGDNTAAIFFLKCRGGTVWKERHQVEMTGADGTPIVLEMTRAEKKLTEMSDEELRENLLAQRQRVAELEAKSLNGNAVR